MNKKISIFLLIIILFVLVIGFLFWIFYYDFFGKISGVDINKQENNTMTTIQSCDELEKEIKDLLEGVNYCEKDSDCMFEWGYYCPFNCYNFFNKNESLQEIDNKVKVFREKNCPFCEYSCIEICDVECANNKCVGIRCSD